MDRAKDPYLPHNSFIYLPERRFSEAVLAKELTLLKIGKDLCIHHQFSRRNVFENRSVAKGKSDSKTDMPEVNHMRLTLGHCLNCDMWLMDCYDLKSNQSWYEGVSKSFVDSVDEALAKTEGALKPILRDWWKSVRKY